MLKALLFDIDNTLILFDELDFFKRYLPAAGRYFVDALPAEDFPRRLVSATRGMMLNSGTVSNLEYFLELFCAGLSLSPAEAWERFRAFYGRDFENFRSLVTLPEGVAGVFVRLAKHGFKYVLASNPIWPRDIQLMRARWAGLEDTDFHFVSHLENMNRCKPHPEYFLQIAYALGVSPGDCLMVGNDLVNDMQASRVGMKTYLVQDGEEINREGTALRRNLLPGAGDLEIAADFQGALRNLPEAVDRLMDER